MAYGPRVVPVRLYKRSKGQSRKRRRQLLDGGLQCLRMHFGGAVCPHCARALLRRFARVFDLAGGHLDEPGLQITRPKLSASFGVYSTTIPVRT